MTPRGAATRDSAASRRGRGRSPAARRRASRWANAGGIVSTAARAGATGPSGPSARPGTRERADRGREAAFTAPVETSSAAQGRPRDGDRDPPAAASQIATTPTPTIREQSGRRLLRARADRRQPASTTGNAPLQRPAPSRPPRRRGAPSAPTSPARRRRRRRPRRPGRFRGGRGPLRQRAARSRAGPEARVEIRAPERVPAAPSLLALGDHAGLAQHLEVMVQCDFVTGKPKAPTRAARQWRRARPRCAAAWDR